MADLELGGRSSVAVETQAEGDTLIVVLSGELDMTNAEIVKSAIVDVLPPAISRVVIETSSLRFMDSSGLALIAFIARKVPDVELRDPSPIVRRLVELTGLAEILNVSP
jgi:anti-anti-sigma factor